MSASVIGLFSGEQRHNKVATDISENSSEGLINRGPNAQIRGSKQVETADALVVKQAQVSIQTRDEFSKLLDSVKNNEHSGINLTGKFVPAPQANPEQIMAISASTGADLDAGKRVDSNIDESNLNVEGLELADLMSFSGVSNTEHSNLKLSNVNRSIQGNNIANENELANLTDQKPNLKRNSTHSSLLTQQKDSSNPSIINSSQGDPKLQVVNPGGLDSVIVGEKGAISLSGSNENSLLTSKAESNHLVFATKDGGKGEQVRFNADTRFADTTRLSSLVLDSKNNLLSTINSEIQSDEILPNKMASKPLATAKSTNANNIELLLNKAPLIDKTTLSNKSPLVDKAALMAVGTVDSAFASLASAASQPVFGSVAPLTTHFSPPVDSSLPIQLQQPLALRNDFSPNLAMRIQWIYQQALSSAEILMDPPELGHLSVKLNRNQGETNVIFHVSNPQTKEMIEDNLAKLKELLQEQGIALGETHVEQKESDQKHENKPDSGSSIVETDQTSNNESIVMSSRLLDTYA